MQGPSQDAGNTAFSYRLSTIEDEVRSLKAQLDRYVTTRENELQLQGMRDSLRRIENDVAAIKQQMQEQEKAAKERDAAQKQSQSQVIIRVLVAILSTIGGLAVTVGAALIIYFLTHLPTTP